jgi:hypothetical protein
MTALVLRARLLQGRLLLGRFGWTNLAALAFLLAGAGACLFLLPGLQDRLTSRQEELADMQARLRREIHQAADTPQAAPPTNLGAFRATLGDIHQADQALKTIFSEADRQLLALDQAEYRLSYDKAGGFYAYSVRLPVKGGYLALRIFCEQVLLSLPYASLDEINFKRRAAGETDIDARLHFTLYLAGPPDYAGGIAATGREGTR